MSNDSYEYKDLGLKSLLKALSEKSEMVKVGILGDNDSREQGNSNATIGQRHEFGIGVPQRSFLREPLSEKLQDYLNSAKAFDEKAFKDVVKEKSLSPWLKKLGILGVQIVNDSFASGGFGKWKPSNMDNKKVKQTLIETQQLVRSITFEVGEK